MGRNAEACVYLYTTALNQPMDHDWSEVYSYNAGGINLRSGITIRGRS